MPSLPDRLRRLIQAERPERQGGDTPPARRPIRRTDRDSDQVDEAAQMEAAAGGEVHAGDVVEVVTADPSFWKQSHFELQFAIEAVARAEISDAIGSFSFLIYFLSPDQGADALILEGDLPQTARAFLGALGPPDLSATLQTLLEDYRSRPETQVGYDVPLEDLGRWTAYAAREDGRFWLLEGRSGLVPATADRRDGVGYRDFACYYGQSQASAQWELRLLEIGGFGQAFQGERVALKDVRFWRRAAN